MRDLVVAVLAVVVGVHVAAPHLPAFADGGSSRQAPAGTAFSFQGRLLVDGVPAAGIQDFQFLMFDDPQAGVSLGSLDRQLVVTNGLFATTLDFGATPFDGRALFIEVHAGPHGAPQLANLGRQPLSPSPLAVFALNGANASWALAGNAGTNPATDFIGTTDNKPFVIRANNLQAMRILPNANGSALNFIGGDASNALFGDLSWSNISGGTNNSIVGPGSGGTIAGGQSNVLGEGHGFNAATIAGGASNTALFSYSTVGGGYGNHSGGGSATVAGGQQNHADGGASTVGGGQQNAAVSGWSTVGGGVSNIAGGPVSLADNGYSATVAGGTSNQAIKGGATVGGGLLNISQGISATISGGFGNQANGELATVPGGKYNHADGIASFAAGLAAHADADGSFAWSDNSSSNGSPWVAGIPNSFVVKATGGVGINTTTPSGALDVNGDTTIRDHLNFGAQVRQMINLWNTAYGIGVQNFTFYTRSDKNFAWYKGGVYSDVELDPGSLGGVRTMYLDGDGNLHIKGVIVPGGADYAELVDASPAAEAGDLLVIDEDGILVPSSSAFDTRVAGVYSTQPGVLGGGDIDALDVDGRIPLAVVGIVPLKVTDENGPIRPGDMLVSSSTAGHAMRAGANPPEGTIVGKALAPLAGNSGSIRVLLR